MIIFRHFNVLSRPFIRRMSSIESRVDLSVDREGIALITMKRLPVNSLNLEILQELSNAVDVVERDKCKGFIITSAVKVFSAGLDLNEFINPDVTRLEAFYSKVQDFLLQIYGSGEITTTVAINGYTAAGGCVITLACDYRVMVANTNAKIGLNDTAVGIAPSPWFCELMSQVMGHRQAEIALTASTMYAAEEALRVNLIDETATDKNEAIEKCKQFIRRYDNIPVKIKAKTKRTIRENSMRNFEKYRHEDLKLFTENILEPNMQKNISIFIQQLKSKKQSVTRNNL